MCQKLKQQQLKLESDVRVISQTWVNSLCENQSISDQLIIRDNNSNNASTSYSPS
jgi:hypothetical protein